jgi:glyoxylase-like metal-dependent hydrolase (beta-lactamase superfamily II)
MKIGNDLNIFVDRRFLVNSYLLTINNTCLIIDPGLNDQSVDNYIKEHHLKLLGIVLTHAHYDHVGNAFLLAKKYGIKIYLHQAEKLTIEQHHFGKELNMIVNIDYDLIQYFHGDKLTIGEFTLAVLLLKGHTPGGVALKYHNYIFSGDTVFYDSIGRTDLALGNMSEMYESLKMFVKYCRDTD